jgi:hypothetical protein
MRDACIYLLSFSLNSSIEDDAKCEAVASQQWGGIKNDQMSCVFHSDFISLILKLGQSILVSSCCVDMDSDVRMGGRQGHRCLVRHTQLMQGKMPKLNQKKLVSFGKKNDARGAIRNGK